MTENELSFEIIGAAIEVHRVLGPGLLESAYEECLCYELRQKEIADRTANLSADAIQGGHRKRKNVSYRYLGGKESYR